MKTFPRPTLLVLPALALMAITFRILAIDLQDPVALWVLVAFAVLVATMSVSSPNVAHRA